MTQRLQTLIFLATYRGNTFTKRTCIQKCRKCTCIINIYRESANLSPNMDQQHNTVIVLAAIIPRAKQLFFLSKVCVRGLGGGGGGAFS